MPLLPLIQKSKTQHKSDEYHAIVNSAGDSSTIYQTDLAFFTYFYTACYLYRLLNLA
ncbi:membrane protein YoaT [Bibersteinia trehalosi USDA-ARS-USMARC-188]|uniref:Membrane protein YoaT n=2 Tax=Bibersteinia trehalosi TaxID=47735 RepID=A0A4V7IB36_BIBTR|nr:membrane protein YoaT [Bibersteinia trehalosi USDA-ARS-USMARC-188]AHG84546.1 membrane protein YoaT [Bibersteinia trehalosi USDA-ARS-USMARC-189]